MPVGEMCNREVVVVQKDADALEAAQLMRHFHVGDLVVVEARDGQNFPVGIVTDRDLVLEILALEVDPHGVTVGDLMTHSLETVPEEADLFDTLHFMRQKAIRRVPVVNREGGLAGILTVDDVVSLLAEQISDISALVAKQPQLEKALRPGS